MPKILGTDFLRTLSHPPKVIFVTAYDHYAVEGYDLDAVDYLVKPVSFERFLKAVTKVKRLVDNETTKQAEEYVPNPDAFVYLKVDKHMQKVLINDIEYIEGWKHYIKVFLAGGRYLLVKESITAIENLLSEHKFLRVHRSYIVSMNRISGYNGLSVLVNSAEIPIGRLYKQEVMKVFNSRC
jgi:DNA-binding LytR/AlgR family response regulator